MLLYQMRDINSMSRENALAQNKYNSYCYAQLGLSDKGWAIKMLAVYKSWDLEPFDLLNCLPLGRNFTSYVSLRILPNP